MWTAILNRKQAELQLPAYKDAAGRRLMRVSSNLDNLPQPLRGAVADGKLSPGDVLVVSLRDHAQQVPEGMHDGVRDASGAGADMMMVVWEHCQQ